MRALDFLVWVRDEMRCMPRSKEGPCLDLPSNGELRRWLKKGSVSVNNKTLTADASVEWPITNLVFFPKNDRMRCTIV